MSLLFAFRTLAPAVVALAVAAGSGRLSPPVLAAQEAAGPGAAFPAQVPDSLDGARYGTLRAPGLVLRFAASDSLVARRVLDFLVSQSRLPGLPDTVPSGVTAVMAHTPEAFDALTGGVVPEWRAGVAVPARRLLVVPTGEGPRILDPEGRRTLRHEWAHLGLHTYLDALRIPRWFDEGYAQWASGGFDATEAWKLRIQLALGKTPPLDSLSLRWPRGRTAADAAYLLAASAVTYLLAEGGERGLTLFLERWRRGRSFEQALRATFGVTGSQFEEDWRKHVRSRYGWVFVLSHSMVFWLVLTLGLLVIFRIRQRDNMEKMARLRADEVPDRPAFWDGEAEARGPDEAQGGTSTT